MHCDLVLTRDGWLLQYQEQCQEGEQYLMIGMNATTEADAISEAHTHGFDEFTIWINGKQKKSVRVPKSPNP
jgi:hypothetical protein